MKKPLINKITLKILKKKIINERNKVTRGQVESDEKNLITPIIFNFYYYYYLMTVYIIFIPQHDIAQQ